MDGDKVNMELTPQELVAEVQGAVDAATADHDGTHGRHSDGLGSQCCSAEADCPTCVADYLAKENALVWLGQLCTALTAALDANQEVAQQKDSAYSQRDRLVAALSKQFPSYLSRHIGEWEEDWRNIVYINLPTGQASWHIHDSELPWFSHLQAFGPEWDGHSDEEKHRRIEALPTGVSLRAALDNERLVSRVTDNALLTVKAELAEAQAEVERLKDGLNTIAAVLIDAATPDKCPRCESPSPERHPATAWEGEVQICPHEWHSQQTNRSRPTPETEQAL